MRRDSVSFSYEAEKKKNLRGVYRVALILCKFTHMKDRYFPTTTEMSKPLDSSKAVL